MGFIYLYLTSDPLQMSLLVFKTFPIEFALGADHFNLDRVREDGLLRVTIYIDRPIRASRAGLVNVPNMWHIYHTKYKNDAL